MEVWLHALLTSALDGGEWLSFRPRPQRLRYPFNRRLGRLYSRSELHLYAFITCTGHLCLCFIKCGAFLIQFDDCQVLKDCTVVTTAYRVAAFLCGRPAGARSNWVGETERCKPLRVENSVCRNRQVGGVAQLLPPTTRRTDTHSFLWLLKTVTSCGFQKGVLNRTMSHS